ncbi:MAG TPA: hypothetical protein VL550_03505 [Rhodocyclaceae bacterium]|nr:hypothetical protein [Rhodocyclaceae bacterium]
MKSTAVPASGNAAKRAMRAVTLVATLLFGTSAFAADAQSQAVTRTEAETFFKRMQEWNVNFDSRYPELYAADAKVTGLHYSDKGDLTITGAQWQQILTFTAFKAKQRNDSSTFSNIHYAKIGDRMKITADRYMTRKCNTDKAYTMVVGRQPDGQVLIEEETFDMGMDNLCK